MPIFHSTVEKNKGIRGLSPLSPNLADSSVENALPLVLKPEPDTSSNAPEGFPRITVIRSESLAGDQDRQIPEKLNLAEFGVTRFVYKTEVEPLLHQLVRAAATPVREIKPAKATSGFDSLLQDSSSSARAPSQGQPALPGATEEVQGTRLVFEPPPAPPLVRSIAMDIGDPESQVRVVIRERNGNLNVQIASPNERLREDLQSAGPMLMRELQRSNPAGVTLDFSHFGSATDSGSHPRSHSRAKKLLKSDAEFADVAETAYPSDPSLTLNSL